MNDTIVGQVAKIKTSSLASEVSQAAAAQSQQEDYMIIKNLEWPMPKYASTKVTGDDSEQGESKGITESQKRGESWSTKVGKYLGGLF